VGGRGRRMQWGRRSRVLIVVVLVFA